MKYRRHYTIFSKIIIYGSLFSLLFLIQQKIFKVKKIDCQLESGQDCPQYVEQQLLLLKGEPLLFNTFEEQLNAIHFEKPTQVFLKYKSLPDTIGIEASIDPGLYRIKDTSWAVTSRGDFFWSDEANLTLVELPKNKSLKTNNNKELANAISDFHPGIKTLLESFKSEAIEVESIVWDSDQKIIVKLSSGLNVLTDLKTLSSTAQKTKLIINKKFKTEKNWGKSELDVRFRLPVLRNLSSV